LLVVSIWSSHYIADLEMDKMVRCKGALAYEFLQGFCWIFTTSGSHSPQESTRRPIYTIKRIPRKKLKTQEEKLAPQEINKEIEDPKIRS
jgi:hypothetical protein